MCCLLRSASSMAMAASQRSNQSALELWGRTPVTEDLPAGLLAQAVRTGEPVRDIAFVVQRRDGSSLPVRVSVTPIADARGSMVAAISTFVEDRTDSDADLRRAQLAAIVVSSDDAIVSKTLDGIIRSWNLGAERVFGYSAEEAIGKHISLIIPPDRIDEEAGVLARLRLGEKIDHFETVRRTKDGRFVDISLTVSPIRSSDGRIVGASKVARDITERRLADEALSRSRRRYQRIFESAGVSIWDEDFTAVRAGLDELRASGVRDFAAYFRERPDEVDRYIRLVRIVDVNEADAPYVRRQGQDAPARVPDIGLHRRDERGLRSGAHGAGRRAAAVRGRKRAAHASR